MSMWGLKKPDGTIVQTIACFTKSSAIWEAAQSIKELGWTTLFLETRAKERRLKHLGYKIIQLSLKEKK